MKVRLTLNLGWPDANRLGIAVPTDGAIVEVKDRAGAELIARSWAVEYQPGKAKDEPEAEVFAPNQDIKAVPPTGVQAVPPVEIKTVGNEPETDEPDETGDARESSDDESSGTDPEPLPTTDDMTSPPKRGPGRPRKNQARPEPA